ncbi:MAG: WD40 repeat domain-containing protein [Burkholderiaceae bacterium]
MAAVSAVAAEFHTLKGHGGPIMGIAVSAADGRVATASFDNSVGLWQRQKPEWLEAHEAAVNVVAFIDEHRLVSAGDDFSILLWDQANRTHRRLGGHRGKVTDLAVSPDRSWIASASWDGSIGLWSAEGESLGFLNGHTAGVNALAISHDGRTLYSASVDGSIRLWDPARRVQRRRLLRHGFGVNEIILGGRASDGRAGWLAYGTVDGRVRVIDIDSAEPLRSFAPERGPVLSMAIAPGGERIAWGDGQGHIVIVNTTSWRIERDFKAALRGPIWALRFSADGESVLAGGIENIVYSWPIDILGAFDPMTDSSPPFLKPADEMSNGERQFARKCSICHSLTDDAAACRADPARHSGAACGQRAGLSIFGYATNLDHCVVGTDDRPLVRPRPRSFHPRQQDADATHHPGWRPR